MAVAGEAAPQTTQEHAEEQPAMTNAAESAEEHPTPVRVQARTPVGDDESARMPPPSSVAEEESRAPTPPPAEEGRVPTPPRARASSVSSPGLDQGPMMPATIDIWERNKELIRKRTDIGEHFTREVIQSIVFIFLPLGERVHLTNQSITTNL